MKKLKRATRIALIAAMMLLMLPLPASAKGGLPYIDYSRLSMGSVYTRPVLQMGELKFTGTLINKDNLTEEEMDVIIEQFIEEHNLTPDDIKYMHDMVELAKRYGEFTAEDYERIIGIWSSAFGFLPTGGAAISTLITILAGDYVGAATSIRDGEISDRVMNEISEISSELGDIIDKGKTGVEILSLLRQLILEYNDRQNELLSRVVGAEARAFLDEFYRDLQEYIDQYNTNRRFRIVFESARADRPNFTFIGQQGCEQWWILDMELIKDSNNPAGEDPAVGTYKGEFTLTAEHDMSDFANDPAKYVNESSILILPIQIAEGFTVNVYTLSPAPTEMTRVIKGTATVTVSAKGEDYSGRKRLGYDYVLSMDGSGAPVLTIDGAQSVGYTAEYSEDDLKVHDEVYFDLTVSEGNNYILITNLNISSTVTSMGHTSTVSSGGGGAGGISIGDDTWRPWESEKSMK